MYAEQITESGGQSLLSLYPAELQAYHVGITATNKAVMHAACRSKARWRSSDVTYAVLFLHTSSYKTMNYMTKALFPCFSQVQGQMEVLNLPWCNLFVWSQKQVN